jgi:hypothetical protein
MLICVSELAGSVREGFGMVVTHHALQHIFSAPSLHTRYSVVYIITVVPTLFPKKSELCSNKMDHLVLRKSALAEKERLTEVCVLLVEGVHALCECEVGIYKCVFWV